MSKTREVLKIYTQPLLILKLKNVCDKREKLKNKTLYITEMGQHLDSHPQAYVRVSQETKISVRFAFLLPGHLCKIDNIFKKKYPQNPQI